MCCLIRGFLTLAVDPPGIPAIAAALLGASVVAVDYA